MRFSFKKSLVSCLAPRLCQIQNLEEGQELRIPEGMPEPAKILTCRGQCVLRSKEWRSGSIVLSAGVTVWVLYLPEDGVSVQCLQSWIPFQFRWDLPEECREGSFRAVCLPVHLDARLVGAGKIALRAGLSAMAECWCPEEQETYDAGEAPEGIELLCREYPLRLTVEAGEKTVSLEETLSLPASAPEMETLLWARLEPQITESRVLGDRVVFRGNGNLNVCYLGTDGMAHSWVFELPFSQYAQLGGTWADANVSFLPAVTELETELTGAGLRLKAQLVCQYLVDQRKSVNIPQDAYIPGQKLELQKEELTLPAILDSRRETVSAEVNLSGEGDIVAEATVTTEFPRQRPGDKGMELEIPGSLSVLYYDAGGRLCSAAQRWEGKLELPMDPDVRLTALPSGGGQTRVDPGAGGIHGRISLPVELAASAGAGIPMLAALETGEEAALDPGRPSLILRRAEEGLWELAKASGSTVDAIRRANALEAEPAPGQLLLIPVV